MQCRFEGIGEALFEIGADLEAIDYRLDGVFLTQLKTRCLVKLHHHTIDPGTHITLGAQFLEDLYVFSLAFLNQGGQ